MYTSALLGILNPTTRNETRPLTSKRKIERPFSGANNGAWLSDSKGPCPPRLKAYSLVLGLLGLGYECEL
jgi:hypothetical protein